MKRSPLLPIFLIVLVDILGLTLMLPLLPFYAERFGATPTQVGMLTGVYALCQLVSGPLLGRLSDSMGRKPLLLVSQIGTCIGFLVLARANALWLVFLSRIIDGSTAGNLSLAQAHIADVTAPENRAKSFGVIGIAFGIGFLIGPAVSGIMAHSLGQSAPIYLAAALSFTSIICTATLLSSKKPEHLVDSSPASSAVAGAPGSSAATASASAPTAPGGQRLALLDWGAYTKYFREPVLRALLLQFLCFTLAFAAFVSGFGLFAERRYTWDGKAFGAREVSWLFAYAGLLGIILQGGLIGRLVKRFGETALVSAGFLSAAIGYVAISGIYSIPPLFVAATFTSFGTGVLRPVLTSLITKQVDRREQGTILGLNQSLMSIAQIGAPILGGFLIAKGWLAGWGILIAALMTIGFLVPRLAAARPVVA